MDKNIKKIDEILVNLFNMVLKLEERAIQEASDRDVSITEIHTLSAIGTGRPRTMTHVANLLGINVSTLTTAVNKLVKKGYVQRVRDDEDRRIVKIYLTEKGVAAAEFHEAFHESMIREAIGELSESELQQFIASIDNIHQFFVRKSSLTYIRKDAFTLTPMRLGAYELPVPIVQAAMGMGIAKNALASAVATEGGLGLIGASAMDPETIEREVAQALKTTRKNRGKGLIGAGIMWNTPQAADCVKAAVKAGAQVIVTSAGIPTDLPKYCSNKKVALLPTISSKRAASAIIRTWTKKYNRVPDGFIFQGPFAAGMLGFKVAQQEKAEQEQYRMIADIKAELAKLEHCPLIAGGGIMKREDAEAVYQYGADGFLMGTRFVATEECDAPDAYKNLYLNCSANDVTIIKSPMKTSLRALRNPFTERIAKEGKEDYDLIASVRKSVEGDFENGLIFCGAGVDAVKSIVSVKDVFKEFT